MINLEMFSIRDSKAELFVQPFFSPTIATGLRSFESAVNDPKSDFFQHADDYTLFHIGTFDQSTGIFSPLESAANLGLASLLIKSHIQGAN